MRTCRMALILALTAAAAGRALPLSADDPQWPAPSPRTAAAAPMKVVALGDSLTSGHRLPRHEAYPALLEAAMAEAGLPFKVINHGMSGDTTAGGVRRLEAALAERPRILIVAFGANDGLRGIPIAQVRANLERIVEGAQERGVSVLLVGMEALPLHGWQYTVDFHHVFTNVAAKYGVPLVPFMLNGVLGIRDLMSSDGVHPNAAGAKVIAANIWSYLKPLAEAAVTDSR